MPQKTTCSLQKLVESPLVSKWLAVKQKQSPMRITVLQCSTTCEQFEGKELQNHNLKFACGVCLDVQFFGFEPFISEKWSANKNRNKGWKPTTRAVRILSTVFFFSKRLLLHAVTLIRYDTFDLFLDLLDLFTCPNLWNHKWRSSQRFPAQKQQGINKFMFSIKMCPVPRF